MLQGRVRPDVRQVCTRARVYKGACAATARGGRVLPRLVARVGCHVLAGMRLVSPGNRSGHGSGGRRTTVAVAWSSGCVRCSACRHRRHRRRDRVDGAHAPPCVAAIGVSQLRDSSESSAPATDGMSVSSRSPPIPTWSTCAVYRFVLAPRLITGTRSRVGGIEGDPRSDERVGLG